MENYIGDLADIVRAGASSSALDTTTSSSTMAIATSPTIEPAAEWQFPGNPTNYSSASGIEEGVLLDDFGDPFPNMQDPLLHDIDMDMASSPMFNIPITAANSICSGGGGGGGSNTSMFPRMLQISPTAKLPVSPCDSPVVGAILSPRLKSPTSRSSMPNDLSNNSPNSNGLQISSPRITGIKRRKSQAKKVVCIPAAAPANSRSSGEVVPSDLWAWRKYGQKPIKGSPYPRGYYRCSSSKGCSARKQVERSRTDPSMLVITYTSEHNHPWPTQRNALAGSTRSQPLKNNNNNNNNSSALNKSSSEIQSQNDSPILKEEQKDQLLNTTYSSQVLIPLNNPTVESIPSSVKEEMDGVDQFGVGVFPESYKPALPDSSNQHQPEDFFADLGEIEVDPLNLLFSQGFSGTENKGLDPFSLYDWPENSNSNNSSTSNLGETNKGSQQNSLNHKENDEWV